VDAGGRERLAMLTMLLSMCEQALATFTAGDGQVDDELVADLRRIVERTRGEIAGLTGITELP
jgi:hypothetical protein